MAIQKIPIYIPTFINSETYTPSRVLPRLFFFNGMVGCQPFYFVDNINSGTAINEFPYFDHYNVVSGSFPTTGSRSLLNNNEAPVYGSQPNQTLYSEYWETYVSLLYDPKTRLIDCEAVIPFAQYIDLNLNDIVTWRGNNFHLRAINQYNVKTGECKIQLLGPILSDALDGIVRI